jgi:hypothetical protein
MRTANYHRVFAIQRLLRWTCVLILASFAYGLPNPVTGSEAARQPGAATATHFAIPLSLLEEHASLHTAFETASKLPGETGAAARRVIALRRPHVEREQRIAYPLLRLLPFIAQGEADAWMSELLPLADELRAALPTLKREHTAIRQALELLRTEAWAEGHPEYAFLAQRLAHHLRIEEEILFPAALVTAECVRARLQPVSR